MTSPILDSTLRDLLDTDFAASPVSASGYGLTEYDERLDDLSADAFRRRDADAQAFLGRLERIGDVAPDGQLLSVDDTIDRDLASAVLRGRLILAPFEGWKRDPVVYSGPVTGGLFTLFLHRLRPEADLVDAAVARLGQVDRVIDAGIANLDADLAHPLIVERGTNAARGATRYVRDLVWQDVEDPRRRERLRAAGEAAAVHLERWVAHLEGFLERAHGSWQLGEDGYSRILQEREVLGDDARALRARGQAEFDRLDAEMTALARDAAGNADYVEVLHEDDQRHPPTEQAMLETYAEWTARARAFLAETGLVTLPAGESCDVVPSPVFQRPILGVASYIAPPSFSDRWKGHFFVPFAPDGASEEEIQSRLSNNSYGSIPTTSVHEAYPGHHWHLVMRKANPSDVRKVYSTPYFSEGWALYAERVDARTRLLRGPDPRAAPPERHAVPGRPDHRRHLAPPGRDDVRRGGHVHDGQGRDARARGQGRGRPVLLVADPGVVVPHRLPRDPRDPGPLSRARAASPAWRRGTSRSRCSARSTTRSRRPAPCRWASPSARSPPRAEGRCRARGRCSTCVSSRLGSCSGRPATTTCSPCSRSRVPGCTTLTRCRSPSRGRTLRLRHSSSRS